MRLAFARLLVDRDCYDAAAHVLIKSFSEAPKDRREYGMWKWWETMFGERKDYDTMKHRIVDALLRRFENADESEKLVLADVFGKGEKESKMSLRDFKKAIDYNYSKK